ncbi:DUF3293 domain-containing protein [Caballeronia sp. INSB1]|uniref:DUF3293 domain-containing protein n=1 Tax=Caballeronia sp. INSB1 TaxID=2921751 RepID=UPI00288C1A53|nr:DUF3293 domain-containing protein [Caballeronia sp. INSB1]
MTLRVGERNEALASYTVKPGLSLAPSASNPYSQKHDDDLNARRQEALADELAKLSLRVIEGGGKHPVDEWGEPSFPVLGVSLEAARRLGVRYEQNALVWCAADAVPQLLLLR